MCKKVDVLILEGNKHFIKQIDKENFITEMYEILGVSGFPEYYSFAGEYVMWWQGERIEKTSAEITVYAGARYPIFIDSKVIIMREDIESGELVDVDVEEVKKYFYTKGSFWALMRHWL